MARHSEVTSHSGRCRRHGGTVGTVKGRANVAGLFAGVPASRMGTAISGARVCYELR
jgi:hypothetical protein